LGGEDVGSGVGEDLLMAMHFPGLENSTQNAKPCIRRAQ
jgi:hypothetical protein